MIIFDESTMGMSYLEMMEEPMTPDRFRAILNQTKVLIRNLYDMGKDMRKIEDSVGMYLRYNDIKATPTQVRKLMAETLSHSN